MSRAGLRLRFRSFAGLFALCCCAMTGCQTAQPRMQSSSAGADYGMCLLADAGRPVEQNDGVFYLAAGDALGHAVFMQYVAMLYTDREYLTAIGELDEPVAP